MEKNTYFEEMKKTAIAYNKAADGRKAERDALIKADDWDGLRAFDERVKKEFPYPYTQGANVALIQYDRSCRNGSDEYEVDDLPWDDQMEDFVKTLRAAKVDKIVVTDQSTGLMDGIYGLTNLGCRMIGLHTITRENDCRFGSKEPEKKNGIEFAIC